ncbi:hypothetical protein GBAR_LOCUS24887, partial [Geodia barretti]
MKMSLKKAVSRIICFGVLWIHLLKLNHAEVAAEVTIKPQEGCVCPDHSYSCRADSLTEIEWDTKISMTSEISYNINREKKYADVESGGLRVLFSEVPVEGGLANLTAQLFLVDQHTWNQSNATCQAIGQGIARQDTVTVCVTGPASPPTSLSVVWDSPSAVVSFQSPLKRCLTASETSPTP